MLEVFGAIIGFVGSTIPSIFQYLNDKSDKKHELNVMELQIKSQKELGEQRINEIEISADINENKELYKTYYSKIKWIDAFNGTVRPTLAYCFFALYAYTKFSYMKTVDFFVLEELWTSVDNTIFLTMIAFYFGQRAMRKIRE